METTRIQLLEQLYNAVKDAYEGDDEVRHVIGCAFMLNDWSICDCDYGNVKNIIDALADCEVDWSKCNG